MLSICRADPFSSESQTLISALADSLLKLSGNQAVEQFDETEFNHHTGVFLLVKNQEQAIACGGFRYLQPGVCEIKRLFSHQAGAGTLVLQALEQLAVEFGYQQINLATRKVNHQAIQFYQKHGYQTTAPFGLYTRHQHYLSLAKSSQLLAQAAVPKKAQWHYRNCA
ncbi:GNAT family N-acetyltransferase [Agarivorans sp. QJM3NY_33]|uniref:GNAT family N-acetyltransferase n=1 Tax=Agarivorans sp. QJM3NY_33 TaxID=3421432 RepID=UPI003D7D9907